MPGGLFGQLLPFVLLLAGCWVLRQQWPNVPDPYISHWNGSWQPDGWTTKSSWNAALPALFGVAMCGLMLVLQTILRRRAITAFDRKEPERRFAELLRARAGNEVLLASELLMAVVFALVTVAVPLAQSPRAAKLFVVSVLTFSIGGGLLLAIWAVVRVNRRMAVVRELGLPWGSTDEEHWKWGVVYSNPDDPRLMVENRMGVGWTFNMARPAAKLTMTLLIVLPLLLMATLLAR